MPCKRAFLRCLISQLAIYIQLACLAEELINVIEKGQILALREENGKKLLGWAIFP